MTNYARRLGLFSGTMAVVGGIIGGGIFRTPATVAERLGTPGGVLFAWVLGGAVALIGAFCWGELGQRRPRAGGGYVYLRETFGPLSAFLYGWTLVLIIATGAMAAVAVTFADYTLALVGLPHRFSMPLAVAAIVFSCWHQLRRRPTRRDHPKHLHDPEARGARGLDRRWPPLGGPNLHHLPPTFTNLHNLLRRRSRSGALHLRGLATDQLHCRRDHRAGAQPPARLGPRRDDRRRGLPPDEPRLSPRPRARRVGGEHRARGGHDEGGPRSCRRQDHRRRDRAVDLRLSESRDSGDAARTAGHGRRWRVLPPLRRSASDLSDADRRHRRARHVRGGADADGDVRAAGGLRDVWGLDFLWIDGSGLVRVSTYGAESTEPGADCSELRAPCSFSCTRLSGHTDTFCERRGLRSLQRNRLQPSQRGDWRRTDWTRNPSVSLLAEPPMIRTSLLVACLATLFSRPVWAQHAHGRSAEQLGRVVFPISCNPEAQQRFSRAMALLHSFWWEQGQAAFQAVADADSTCAMAYWAWRSTPGAIRLWEVPAATRGRATPCAAARRPPSGRLH